MKMNKIKGFTFYRSYYESLKNLKEKDKKEIINAILEYVFDDKIPNFGGIKCTIWTLIEPNLNTSKHRSNDNSGAPEGNQNACKYKENQRKNNLNNKQSKNNQKTINDLYDKDKDKEIDKDKEKEWENINISANAPTPTLSDILIYSTEIGFDDKEYCENFYNHYEAIGWVNGSGQKIKNWKLIFNIWLKKDKKEKKNEEEYIDEAGFVHRNGRRIL